MAPKSKFTDGITKESRVRATQDKNEVRKGDTGIVMAAWENASVLVRWDKDSIPRPLNRKRLEIIHDRS